MLVRITNRCYMNCSHCMIDASPLGEHMTLEVYSQALDFVERYSCFGSMVMLSGGEPTDHPNILEMIDRALAKQIKVLLLSNGLFVENKELAKELLQRDISIQVTNDARFYPKKVQEIDHARVMYERNIRLISPFGRAVKNQISCSRSSPLCFNLRSLVRNTSLYFAIFKLRLLGKFCTPSINVDGTLAAGESSFCSTFGNVTESDSQLTERLHELKCGRCGLYEGLDRRYLEAIGE